MKEYDFLAIGDIVTDAFIKLREATVEDGTGRGFRKICMRFGDKIPYENVTVVPAVGNSINAAVSASRLGLNSAVVTNIGDDYYGKECLEALKREKVGTEFVKSHKNRKTNYHYVLTFNAERTILIKHENYDYSFPGIKEPKCVYLSSLGENSLPFHSEVENYLNEHPDVKLVFQPGTFQMRFGPEKLSGIYRRTDLFFCNKEEARRILGDENKEIKDLLLGLHKLGPKIVSITDGTEGAYVSSQKEKIVWFLPMYPDPHPPVDRTGAGDAYSSTFAAALILGKSIPEALTWGPINSMSVVQKIGAREGLLTQEEIKKYLNRAPEHYKAKKL